MNEYDASETAYKNGYKQGIKEFAERLLKNYTITNDNLDDVVLDTDIRNLAEEMIEEELNLLD